jgi:hypothetical protein
VRVDQRLAQDGQQALELLLYQIARYVVPTVASEMAHNCSGEGSSRGAEVMAEDMPRAM